MTLHWRAPAGLHTASVRLPVEGELGSFDGATGWLNSAPLTPAGLRGKVVLVNFWTYTCINWLRQLPYVRAWAGKYSGQGLVVIGVHTPEFGFEHNPDNVRRATAAMRVDYPVATDNDYAVWRAFDNYYWPALYFADAQGRIRHHNFGEGEYAQSEMVIQQLLDDAGATGISYDMVSPEARGLEVPADWADLRSPENYTGYERTENFASPGGAVPGKPHVYAAPAGLRLNQWALSGNWTTEEQPRKTPCGSGCSLTGSRPARRTETTWTAKATARSPSSGCTSSSASPGRSPTAPSRSRSSTRAPRPTPSPSADRRRAREGNVTPRPVRYELKIFSPNEPWCQREVSFQRESA